MLSSVSLVPKYFHYSVLKTPWHLFLVMLLNIPKIVALIDLDEK